MRKNKLPKQTQLILNGLIRKILFLSLSVLILVVQVHISEVSSFLGWKWRCTEPHTNHCWRHSLYSNSGGCLVMILEIMWCRFWLVQFWSLLLGWFSLMWLKHCLKKFGSKETKGSFTINILLGLTLPPRSLLSVFPSKIYA